MVGKFKNLYRWRLSTSKAVHLTRSVGLAHVQPTHTRTRTHVRTHTYTDTHTVVVVVVSSSPPTVIHCQHINTACVYIYIYTVICNCPFPVIRTDRQGCCGSGNHFFKDLIYIIYIYKDTYTIYRIIPRLYRIVGSRSSWSSRRSRPSPYHNQRRITNVMRFIIIVIIDTDIIY